MKYELSLYPPSLFEAKNLMRKPEKAQLLDTIRWHVTSSEDAVLQSIPKTDHYVLDGGSLLHRLKWTEGSTYSPIADAYASFTSDLSGNATVVWWIWWRTKYKRQYASAMKSNSCFEKGQHIGYNNIRWEKGRFPLKWYEQTGPHPLDLWTLVAERLSYHPSWRRCRLGHSESIRRNDIRQFNNPDRRRHRSAGIAAVSCNYEGLQGPVLWSDKGKPNVYNIEFLKRLLSDGVCSDRSFAQMWARTSPDVTLLYFENLWGREEICFPKSHQGWICLAYLFRSFAHQWSINLL